MKETIVTMLKHPIASCLIIGTATMGLASVIDAVKGNDVRPMVSITTSDKPKTE